MLNQWGLNYLLHDAMYPIEQSLCYKCQSINLSNNKTQQYEKDKYLMT